MTKFCIICGKKLIGRQRILCSDEECNRERRREYDHERYQNNREEILEQRHEYRQNNQEEINKRAYEYRLNNPEKVKERNNKWRQNNSKKILENNRKYRLNNQEKVNKWGRKCYRRVRGLPEDADLRKESSLERIMREWLQKNNIEFIEQYYINLENSTWTWVDFYIPELNVCLYCDGDYHHLLLDTKERDINQNKILPQMGYNVVRMSEAEILEGNRPNELKN